MAFVLSEADPCPEKFKCGENALCMIDRFLPKTFVCACDPGMEKDEDDKCVGE